MKALKSRIQLNWQFHGNIGETTVSVVIGILHIFCPWGNGANQYVFRKMTQPACNREKNLALNIVLNEPITTLLSNGLSSKVFSAEPG